MSAPVAAASIAAPCGFAAADVAYDAGVALAAAQTLRAAFSGTTPHESVTILISALESGICHNLESAVSANRRSLFQHIPHNVRVPETIWGFHTHCGFCPVHVSTRLSSAMANRTGELMTKESHQFQHEPDKKKTLVSQLETVLKLPVIAELCALLDAGLLPYSMASKFGEEERKGACNLPLFWWVMVRPQRNTSATPADRLLAKTADPSYPRYSALQDSIQVCAPHMLELV